MLCILYVFVVATGWFKVKGVTHYSDLIMEIATKLGRENVNPRWVEAFMSLEYPSLNSISRESFQREVKVAINCIGAIGPEKAEQCAQSFGL